ncbi:Uncharacterized protein SCG7109_BV_00020 [Chlamydiales bacterium SCGC AG-110-M15]|nr:Uncharacterized protein SCG7109_BV_00020 [Chlamydiales bacterium SCGC AG-110-M15]
MNWLLHPQSLFHREWNHVILIVILYNALLLPFQIGFGSEIPSYIITINFIADLILVTDIVFNFFTGYISEGLLVQNLKCVRINYLKTWFIFDFIASLPFDALALFIGIEHFGGIAAIPFLRLPRLMRLIRVKPYFRHWEKNLQVNPSILRLVKLGASVIISAHFIACSWFGIGVIEAQTGQSWLNTQNLLEASTYDQYVHSLYWALVTMTTVGFGDITPTTSTEILFTMIAMCIGVSIYAYIIGNMASLVANIDAVAQAYRQKMDSINNYMRLREIPVELQKRIRRYYDYVWSRNKGLSEVNLLSDLPAPLYTELKLFLHREVLQKVPLFHEADSVFLSALVKILQPVSSAPGDFIINEGEIGREMYFISRGNVEVLSGDGKTIYAELSDGAFFGEIALLFSEKRTASIQAKSYCDLFIMKKDDFDVVLKDYPEFASKMLQIAKERYQKHN